MADKGKDKPTAEQAAELKERLGNLRKMAEETGQTKAVEAMDDLLGKLGEEDGGEEEDADDDEIGDNERDGECPEALETLDAPCPFRRDLKNRGQQAQDRDMTAGAAATTATGGM